MGASCERGDRGRRESKEIGQYQRTSDRIAQKFRLGLQPPVTFQTLFTHGPPERYDHMKETSGTKGVPNLAYSVYRILQSLIHIINPKTNIEVTGEKTVDLESCNLKCSSTLSYSVF